VSKLKKLTTGALSRSLKIAQLGVSAGAQLAGTKFGNLFGSQERADQRLQELLVSQVGKLASELGRLKGSLMKAGQMLSVYGEHWLPPEVNAALKTLQSQSPPMEWSALEPQVRRALGEKMDLLEIDPEPIGAASLGQVHRARIREGHPDAGQWIALKVQYPGVEDAIEGDLKAIRTLFQVTKILPDPDQYQALFDEVKIMLRQEVDYRNELEDTQTYRVRLPQDSPVIVPRAYPDFSSSRILATSLEEGHAIDSPEVQSLSQERRNAIAIQMLELYFAELFEWGMVQTDPHIGNYRVRIADQADTKGVYCDRLISYDFGAIQRLKDPFWAAYKRMIAASFFGDEAGVQQAAHSLGFLKKDDPPELVGAFCRFCVMVVEPFRIDAVYDFAASDLPSRALAEAKNIAVLFKFRPPPREIIFLDRKTGGVFIFLTVLRAKIAGHSVLKRSLAKTS
jgi:predicted unusual protein kinase regulating ubiquinone biosynthesis (AarF/ABC1/UbiB family)